MSFMFSVKRVSVMSVFLNTREKIQVFFCKLYLWAFMPLLDRTVESRDRNQAQVAASTVAPYVGAQTTRLSVATKFYIS